MARRHRWKQSICERSSRWWGEYWSPRIIGELNDSYVKVVKLKGEFIWHHHEHEDELFLVVAGRLKMRFRDRDVASNQANS